MSESFFWCQTKEYRSTDIPFTGFWLAVWEI